MQAVTISVGADKRGFATTDGMVDAKDEAQQGPCPIAEDGNNEQGGKPKNNRRIGIGAIDSDGLDGKEDEEPGERQEG